MAIAPRDTVTLTILPDLGAQASSADVGSQGVTPDQGSTAGGYEVTGGASGPGS